MLTFERHLRNETGRSDLAPKALIVAGWTGRDEKALGTRGDRRAPSVVRASILPHQHGKSHTNGGPRSSRTRHLRRGGACDRGDAGWIVAWRRIRSH